MIEGIIGLLSLLVTAVIIRLFSQSASLEKRIDRLETKLDAEVRARISFQSAYLLLHAFASAIVASIRRGDTPTEEQLREVENMPKAPKV